MLSVRKTGLVGAGIIALTASLLSNVPQASAATVQPETSATNTTPTSSNALPELCVAPTPDASEAKPSASPSSTITLDTTPAPEGSEGENADAVATEEASTDDATESHASPTASEAESASIDELSDVDANNIEITSRAATLEPSPTSSSTATASPVSMQTPEASSSPSAQPTSSQTASPTASPEADPVESPEPPTTPSPSTSPSAEPTTSPVPSQSPSPSTSASPEPTTSPEPTSSPKPSATPDVSDPAWVCPEPVTSPQATPGNNSVTVSWGPPANADQVEITDYYLQVASTGRIIRVEADTLRTQVTGLRNGVAESFLVYAATEHGRSEAADSVTATPTSGMEGEVAGLIVKFAGSPNLTDGQSDVPGKDKVSSVDLTVDTKIADGVHLIELSESVSPEQASQVAAELQSDPSVEWAEPDVFVFPSSVPNDPEYESSQWNLWDEWGLGLPRTSNDATSFDPQAGAGVTVAVIDTGITSHPDLDSQLVPGYDFVSDPANLAASRVAGGPDVGFDDDGQPGRDADPTDPGDWRGVTPTRDSTWHGTQVAGVIAAQSGNSEGIVGIAPGAKIQPIRALSWRGGLMSDIISSITWASGGSVDGAPANANPSDVITMSFAANAQCSVALQAAIDGATSRGSVLVAAAGNANDDVANYAPANCRDVIAVAATGREGKRAPYSNYGPGIDIAAPGGSLTGAGGVLSTSNSGMQGPESAGYRSGEGTSIAAAHVAGAIAHAKATEPDISSSDLRARFLSGEQVRAFPDEQCDADPNVDCGTGLLTLAQVMSVPGVVVDGLSVSVSGMFTFSGSNELFVPYANSSDRLTVSGNAVNFGGSSGTVVGLGYSRWQLSPDSWLLLTSMFNSSNSVKIFFKSLEPPKDFTTTTKPTISGTLEVGDTLTASTNDWTPLQTGFTHQWKRNGADIAGATSSTYVLEGADYQQQISVAVTGSLTGYNSATEISAPTGLIAEGTFVSTPAPTISGSPSVGFKLTANTNWSPSGNFSYQWKSNGTDITNATSSEYEVQSSDIGKRISVAVTGSATGYGTVGPLESEPTAEVPSNVFSSTSVPMISGTAEIGQTLTASVSGWVPEPDSFSYQWHANDQPIDGANSDVYSVSGLDVGKRLSVQVTAKKSGLNDAVEVSPQLSSVPFGVFSASPAPSVNGMVVEGEVLTAVTSNWTPVQDSFSYQWKADGADIVGATSSTYQVSADDVSKAISVTITGTRVGYTSVSVSSNPKVAPYTITFDSNGMNRKTGGGNYVAPPLLNEVGVPFDISRLPETPASQFGIWGFLGWYDGDTPVFTYDSDAKTYSLHADLQNTGWLPTADTTLTAHWWRRIVVYDRNSITGNLCEGSSSPQTITITASDPTPTIILPRPSSSSAQFISWFASRQPRDPSPSLEQDTRWPEGDPRKPVRVYDQNGNLLGLQVVVDNDLPESTCTSWQATVTYEPGPGATVETTSDTGFLGEAKTTPTPWRPGWAFEKWNLPYRAPGSDSPRRGDASHRLLKNETWTAQWKQIPSAPELLSASLSSDRKTIRLEFSDDVQDLYSGQYLCEEFEWQSTDATFDAGTGRSCSLSGSVLEITPNSNGLADSSADLSIAYKGRSLASSASRVDFVHQTDEMTVEGVGFDVAYEGNGGTSDRSRDRIGPRTPLVLPSASRTGYIFEGWFTDETGGDLAGSEGDSFVPTENVVLYARWRAIVAAPPVGSPPSSTSPRVPPRLDVRPPRIELEIPERPTPARPASVVINGEEVQLIVERDEDNTELDVTGDDFALTVATSDTQRTRITPTSRRSLVAPVRGFVEVNAAGYAPQSVVALYLVPALSPRMSLRNATELYFLGEVSVNEDQTFDDAFQLPDWALAGEYSLQINGYTPAGALKSINLRLDLIDRRADAVSVARACVFPEDSVQLTTQCRQSLRSLKQVLPDSVDTLTIDITGVAYAQGNRKLNRAVALERAERVEAFLERNEIAGDVTVDVVTRKELVPGFTLGPPPVVVGDSGKPASTVVMTVEWTTEIGPEEALAELEPLQVT